MAQALAKVPQAIGCMVAGARPRLATFWRYAKVELKPPMPSEFGEVSSGLARLSKSAMTGKWRHLTVKVRPLSFRFFLVN